MIKLNDLFNNPGSKKKYKRLGRGIGSGKGKTCGRGGKGQTARSGVALKWFEGGQTPLIRRVPKRGFVGKSKKLLISVNLYQIQRFIESSAGKSLCVDKEFLIRNNLIRNDGYKVKLLAYCEDEQIRLDGVTFNLDGYSSVALDLIKSSGGAVQNI
jgi:large subunit ribosomal protein L15